MSRSTSDTAKAHTPGRRGPIRRWQDALRSRWGRPGLLWLGTRGASELAAVGTTGAAAAAPMALADWAAGHAGAAVDGVVSEHLLNHLVCEDGLPLADAAAIEAYAGQLFGHYFGAGAARWPIAAWSHAGTRGACALHGADWAATRASLAAQQIGLRSLRPAWAAALQQLAVQDRAWFQAPDAALAWVEGELLTWLALQGGRCTGLRHLRLAAATSDALAQALGELGGERTQVMVLGYGLATGAGEGEGEVLAQPRFRLLGRLDGSAPDRACFGPPGKGGAQAPRPDFAARRPAASPLGWALAITGALVLATALVSAGEAFADRQQAADRLAHLRQSLQGRQAGAPPRRPLPAPAAAMAEPDRLRALAEVHQLLGHPWGALLAQVEQAGSPGTADAVQWLALDYAAGRTDLRLQGQSSDKASALRIVDRLGRAPGWRDVVLSRFQSAEEGQGGERFELAARIQPHALQAARVPEPPALAPEPALPKGAP